MLEKIKDGAEFILKSAYEKVYLINFENCSFVPSVEQEILNKLGKCYVSTGKEWICHSQLEIKDFETLFLNLLDEELKSTVRFDVDYMPFQKA